MYWPCGYIYKQIVENKMERQQNETPGIEERRGGFKLKAVI